MSKKTIKDILLELEKHSESGEYEVWIEDNLVYDYIVDNGKLELFSEPWEGMTEADVILIWELSDYINEYKGPILPQEYRYKIIDRKLIIL